MDREKIIKGLEGTEIMLKQAVDRGGEMAVMGAFKCYNHVSDAIALLKEQEVKPPVHIHEEYPEHDWERKENGDIDDFAYNGDYHNGPMCKRCYYSFCIHCDPDGWNKKPCIIDEYKCPKCGRYISKGTKFCSDCGQKVKWE